MIPFPALLYHHQNDTGHVSIKSADDPSNYDEGWQGLSRLIFLALTLDAYRNTVLTSIHEPLNSVQNRVCSISL
jgi:hypothetical protein